MVQDREALRLKGDTLAAYNIQNKAFLKAAKDVEKAKAVSCKALVKLIKTLDKKSL